MQAKKGDVVRADLKLGDNVVSRYFVVTDGNKLFQVAEGYNVTSVGIGEHRKREYITNVPILPNKENHLTRQSVIKMDTLFVAPEEKITEQVGHLSKDEQLVVDTYQKIYKENGIIIQTNLDSLDDKMRRQYELFNAVKDNDDQKVENLLHNGAIADEPKQGTTPLHWAAEHGAAKSAAVLIKHGAYVDSLNQDEKTPLFKAVENDDADMTQLLLESGANPNIRANGVKVEDVTHSQNITQMVKEYAAAAQAEDDREREPNLKR